LLLQDATADVTTWLIVVFLLVEQVDAISLMTVASIDIYCFFCFVLLQCKNAIAQVAFSLSCSCSAAAGVILAGVVLDADL